MDEFCLAVPESVGGGGTGYYYAGPHFDHTVGLLC